MAKFVEVERLRRRGGFRDIADLNLTLGEFLEAATTHLAEELRVDTFDRVVNQEDIFYVDWEELPFRTGGGDRIRSHHHGHIHGHNPHGFFTMYLRNGFVVNDPTNFPVKMERAFQLEDFVLGTGIQEIDVSFADIKFDKGYIVVTDADAFVRLFTEPRVNREFVRVTYTSGFTETNGDKQPEDGRIYRDKQTPDWIEEAAIMMATKLFAETGKCSKEDAARCRALSMRLPAFLQKHIRFNPQSVKPLNYP